VAIVSIAHKLYEVSIAGNVFDQISNWNWNAGVIEAILSGDGGVDPTFVAVNEAKPVISFTTTACKTALDFSALDGLAFNSNTGIFYFMKMDEGGTHTLATQNIKLLVDEGMCLPRQITATQGQPATVNYDVICASTDGLVPLAFTDGQTIGSQPVAVAEAYTVGEVSLKGTAVKGIQSLTVDFGIIESVLSGDGAVWPTFVGIIERKPFITFTTTDLGMLANAPTLGSFGVAQTTGGTDSTFKFAQMDEGTAGRASTPLTFTMDEGRISYETIGGAHGEPQIASVRVTPSAAAAAILVYSS
jgi:hypothetical protein